MASGLQFPSPSWAWRRPWGWYKEIAIMSFSRVQLTKIPKIHVKSFKTVKARASGLNSPTSSWAWSWPWGWYQKIPIMFIQRANMSNKFPKIHGCDIKTVHVRASWLHFPTPFWVWGRPGWWYPKSDLTRLLAHVLLMSYPKIIFLGLVVSEELAKKIIFFRVFYYM